MRNLVVVTASLWCVTAPAFAGDVFDPAKWIQAKHIDYQITGVFDGRANVDSMGDGRFLDRVEISFTTSQESFLEGTIQIRNFPSQVSDLRSKPEGCFVPEPKGAIELYTLVSVELVENSLLTAMTTERTEFPAMRVAQGCSAAREVGPRVLTNHNPFPVWPVGVYLMDPAVVAGMGAQYDRATGTTITKNGAWTWTTVATPR